MAHLLIDLERVCRQERFDVKGVIHLGAHKAEEHPVYRNIGAKKKLYVEANESLIPDLKEKFKDNANIQIVKAVISSHKHKAVFKVHNDTHTSSILDMDFIAESHPELTIEREQEVETTSLDELMVDNKIDPTLFNFLTIDVQGVEYEALLGSEKTLETIDFVYTEVETKSLYIGAENYSKIREFLYSKGFVLVTEQIRNWYWGDCLFQKIN